MFSHIIQRRTKVLWLCFGKSKLWLTFRRDVGFWFSLWFLIPSRQTAAASYYLQINFRGWIFPCITSIGVTWHFNVTLFFRMSAQINRSITQINRSTNEPQAECGQSCTCSVSSLKLLMWLNQTVTFTAGTASRAQTSEDETLLFVCLFATVNKPSLCFCRQVFLLSAADLKSAGGQCSKSHCCIHNEELTPGGLWVRGGRRSERRNRIQTVI